MITYFVLWCYLLIQGMAQIHRSSAFSKRRGVTSYSSLQYLIHPCAALVQGSTSLVLVDITHSGTTRKKTIFRNKQYMGH
jgi:hypothetical protein